KSLDGRLEMLSEWAEFQVNINSVLGSGVKNSEDALKIARRALELGFTSTVGIIHDHDGQLRPLAPRDREIFEEIMTLGKRSFSRFNQFQHNVAMGREHDWKCRAGSRYLYVCEDGLVHWCSQQRGYPGIPLTAYGPDDLEREYHHVKDCAPMCTVGCVHRVAQVDELRRDPQGTLAQWFPAGPGARVTRPIGIEILLWAFVKSSRSGAFRAAALRVF